jgi:hypothetical protein
VRELTVTKKVTLTCTTKKPPIPRYPRKTRPQAVRQEAFVHYKILARLDPACRSGY